MELRIPVYKHCVHLLIDYGLFYKVSSRACHVTLYTVFVRRYTQFHTLSLSLSPFFNPSSSAIAQVLDSDHDTVYCTILFALQNTAL